MSIIYRLMQKIATVYEPERFINAVKYSGYAITHRTFGDTHLMYVKYTENNNYTKDEGASANRES